MSDAPSPEKAETRLLLLRFSSDLTTKGGSSSKVTQTLHTLSATESLADRFFIMSWGPLKD